MSDGLEASEEAEKDIERGVVRAFGSALIEFEAVLFQKYLMLSASRSITSEDDFRKYLRKMHAKGYLTPMEFQNKKVWKKLIVESDIDEHALTPEQIQEILEQAKIATGKGRNYLPKAREHLVSESKIMAEDLKDAIKSKLAKIEGRDKATESRVLQHVRRMRRALTDSKRGFLEYVRLNLPDLSRPMEKILDTKGEDILLLSLRIIEVS